MQDYKITVLGKQEDTQWGPKISFKLQEYGEQWLSAFTRFPDSIQMGKTIYGEVVEKKLGDKTFLNFKWPKKEAKPVALSDDAATLRLNNVIDHKLTPALDRLEKLISLITREL